MFDAARNGLKLEARETKLVKHISDLLWIEPLLTLEPTAVLNKACETHPGFTLNWNTFNFGTNSCLEQSLWNTSKIYKEACEFNRQKVSNSRVARNINDKRYQ